LVLNCKWPLWVDAVEKGVEEAREQ
jgi:hypothetical protein